MDKCNCTIEKFPKRPALSRRVSNYSYNCECISGFRLQKFPELSNRNTYWCNYSVTLSFTHSYLYSLLLSILHLCMHQLLYSLTHQFYHNWVKNPKKLGSFFLFQFHHFSVVCARVVLPPGSATTSLKQVCTSLALMGTF